MWNPVFAPPLATPAADIDVAIVGAGAAGIAAARLCLASGLSVAVLEARDRVGGRAVTAAFGGHPVDLGAHWLHAGALNPLVRLGWSRGERLRRAPARSHLMVEGRSASREERAAQGGGFERMERAIALAARGERDRAIAGVVPLLGRWRQAVTATHALISGRPLHEVSVKDYPRDEFGDNYFVQGGYGAYLARLAAGLPVALRTAVSGIDWSGAGVTLATARGTVRAGAVIITVPVPVLQAGAIRFDPVLPDRSAAAAAGFLAGTYEHVVLNWPDPPFAGPDRLAKLVGRRLTLGLMTGMEGAPFHYLELDHETAMRLPDRDAAARFARTALKAHVGARGLARLRVLGVPNGVAIPGRSAPGLSCRPGATAIATRSASPWRTGSGLPERRRRDRNGAPSAARGRRASARRVPWPGCCGRQISASPPVRPYPRARKRHNPQHRERESGQCRRGMGRSKDRTRRSRC